MITAKAIHAATRFGLGVAPDKISAIEPDPKQWVLNQLNQQADAPSLNILSKQGKALAQQLYDIKKNREYKEMIKKDIRTYYYKSLLARFQHQQHSANPMLERLVLFWSNHFAISVDKGPFVRPLALAFETEAIRPHILGNFIDMLLASSRHPAMLIYLDNAKSIGPDSMVGKKRKKGLNENLAREILELHTMGVDAGYSQADVIALAQLITGWSLTKYNKKILPEFTFNKAAHEPGEKNLLGHRFTNNNEQDGIDALTMVAHHPSTAHFIATKLATHFISDSPTKEAIDYLAGVFLSSKGNLLDVTTALVELDDCWNTPMAKIKTPYDYMLSTALLLDIKKPTKLIFNALNEMAHTIYKPGSPAGFPDQASHWINPDAIVKRIQWASKLTNSMAKLPDPVALATSSYGPILSDSTLFAISNAPSRAEGVAALLVSPEFQKR